MELDLGLDIQEHGEGREPTVLEFARFHHLCEDHTQDNMLYGMLVPPLDETIDQDLCDPPNAPTLTNKVHGLMKEPLAISNQSALLLKEVFLLASTPDRADAVCGGDKRVRGLKQEVPLLRTDDEIDLLSFGSTAIPNLTDLRIPLEPVDEAKGEGLEWPVRYWAYPAEKDEWAKKESSKLAMKREDLFWLQDAVRNTYMDDDGEAIMKENLRYKRDMALEPVTPPLLPLTPPPSPYIPSSPANQLQLLSEESNSTAAEAKGLEDQIMGEDSLTQNEANNIDLMVIDMFGDLLPTSSPDRPISILKRKVDNLMVETPLTPPMFSGSPSKRLKTVTFDDLPQYIESTGLEELPSLYENDDDVLTAEDDFSGFYKEIEPLAQEVNWKVENESLSEADTTKRVDVPMVDSSLPIAPWDKFKRSAGDTKEGHTDLEAQKLFLLLIKRDLNASSWKGISQLERELPSAPFPSQSVNVVIEEKLHGEGNLNLMLMEPTEGDIVTSSSSIWKRDGLRILEGDENDEEELELLQMQERRDVDSLVRKRKLEIDQKAADAERQREPSPARLPASHRHHKTHKSQHRKTRVAQEDKELDGSLMFGGGLSASKAMYNFMSLQGMEAKPRKAQKKPETVSNHFPESFTSLPIRSRSPSHSSRTSENQQKATGPLPLPLPKLPTIPEVLPSCSFIISSTLLQQRHLTKQIEKLYPNAEFVSRDFDIPRSTCKEADLLLSPSTGLILTTLQQVKQRALPGQPDTSQLKERIITLQERYETLVVIVSEGLSREMEERGTGRPADARDYEALTAFERFASGMEADVLVRFVQGGDQALSRSVVQEMAKYGLPYGSKDIGDVKPLADESNWELLLRRAGLNPFAAQVILAYLKDPIVYQVPGTPSHMMLLRGLGRFVIMDVRERVESFQGLMGGARVLRRVSVLLDQRWASAVNGYRMDRDGRMGRIAWLRKGE
ncbi:hypothetical protein P280DRAFT_441736 [Massarina eburnea CBS 473.64]|uniref:Uncharacterized protein n=1 Tax=Massarina eburnea CBS 473.64 TaxID=1395130 RepID=A0A6A6SEQ4_9PLEO|nr:hypothetical protein P280DRAFT_441736 [Massarina eburnea CBS 473.64]